MKLMPQEIEVWYIIPSIRRELAKALVAEEGLSQKKAAELLGITKSAVTQYLNSRRASQVDLGEAVAEQVKAAAKRIAVEQSDPLLEIQTILAGIDIKEIICRMHKEQDTCISDECDICMNLGGMR